MECVLSSTRLSGSVHPALEGLERSAVESDGPQERGEVRVLPVDQRADHRDLAPSHVLEHGFEEAPSDGPALEIRIHAEALDPARGLLEAELAAPDVREHEPHHLAGVFRDRTRLGIAAEVVSDPALPDVGP